jgi:hypothetical protein
MDGEKHEQEPGKYRTNLEKMFNSSKNTACEKRNVNERIRKACSAYGSSRILRGKQGISDFTQMFLFVKE